jgi:hypothetical protein
MYNILSTKILKYFVDSVDCELLAIVASLNILIRILNAKTIDGNIANVNVKYKQKKLKKTQKICDENENISN